jgi:exodeoxyribonuclease V gamma subunit
MNIFLFDSHSLEANAAELFTQLKKDGVGIFSDAMIVVAHPSVKEWLQMELCKLSPCKSTMGLNFLGWRKAVQILSGESFFPSLAEIGAAIWQSLEREPIAACEQFLDSESKSIDFVFHLARIFSEYNEYGFPEKFPESMRWQKDLFESIFKRTLDEAIVIQSGPIYVFGVDVMPPSVLRFFFKCDLFRLFRFSPCAMFWEDFCSTAERKRILKSLEKKQFKASQLEALDQLLIDTQPLLANWGKLGRKMLALVPEVTAENYVIDETEAQLTGLKLDLLLSSQEHRDLSSDGSIRLIRTGSSRCNEVLSLQHELLHYAAQGISFSDMRVYAPDIGLYAPIIEFCFKDIPFRIAGVDIARKSPFYQAILLLFSCVKGRWESDVILSLLEMPVVHKKAGWKIEEVNRIAQWIHRSGIRWGLDGRHRGELAGVSTVEGSGGWESGIDSLLDSWMFFQPEKESSVGWSESELFEKFYSFFETLRATLISWNKERSLFDWAIEIQQLIELYLWSDGDSISEKEISQSLQYIRSLGELYPEDLFPFSFIEKFFFTDISGELGASSLHSVRFASLELGAMMPAKVVFVLGMDEESFPRAPLHSSLRLPNHVAVTRSESDRYLFLSLIFSAKDHLIFSYGHISGDDGKVVSPSLLIQELFGYLKNSQSETYVAESVESEKATPSLLTHSVP